MVKFSIYLNRGVFLMPARALEKINTPKLQKCVHVCCLLQPNVNGSNIFGTMKFILDMGSSSY